MEKFNQSGNNRFSGNRGGSRFGRRDSGQPITMHKATCSDCGKNCEVPFRPTSGKPVYCNDCFKGKGNTGGDRRGSDRGSDDIKRQLEALNIKLDRLIQAIDIFTQTKPAVKKVAKKAVVIKKNKK